ncbi:MAG: hypothetical protein JSR78_16255 [Proteobacteria bacterium]|nr:hypothetical protein [Pseudomonadota bacterium]
MMAATHLPETQNACVRFDRAKAKENRPWLAPEGGQKSSKSSSFDGARNLDCFASVRKFCGAIQTSKVSDGTSTFRI